MLIERGHVYRAKKPKQIRLFLEGDFYDDRMVVWMNDTKVQYDSPTVYRGSHYRMGDRARFEKWAGSDVTEGYPKGDWAKWPTSG